MEAKHFPIETKQKSALPGDLDLPSADLDRPGFSAVTNNIFQQTLYNVY